MKAVKTPTGWEFHADAVTDPEATYDWQDIPKPPVPDGSIAVPGLAVDEDAKVVKRTWLVRPTTDAEATVNKEQLVIIEHLTDDELIALDDACLPGSTHRAIAIRVRTALAGAVETHSRTERTKRFMAAAMQLGIVKSIERARTILGDPGFVIE